MKVAIRGVLSTIKPGTDTIPPTGVPSLNSIGVVDSYLAPSHPIGSCGEFLMVNCPKLSIRLYQPFFGFSFTIHSFSWRGEFHITLSFAETIVGKVDQESHGDEGTNGCKSPIRSFCDHYLNILTLASSA